MTHSDKRLDALINSASKEMPPERDLWPEISARLQPSSSPELSGNRASIWPVTAIAALLVLGLALSPLLRFQQPNAGDSPLLSLVESTRQTHIQHMQQLMPLTSKIHLRDKPELIALSASETQLRQAEEQVYQQLLQSPEDTSLWEMWLWLHQQEIELQLNLNQLTKSQLYQGAQI